MAPPQSFKGFPPGKTHVVRVPALFFTELLAAIDDLAELKVTLYCFWALQQQEGRLRYVRLREILGDSRFVAGLDPDADRAAELIRQALQRATGRGTLLEAVVEGVDGPEPLYFMNTPQGRNAVRAIAGGQFVPGERTTPVALIVEQPNLFALYEQNIGALTPLIADQLRAAEQDYPAEWIAEAIQIAVTHNKRSWKYIEAILKRWQAEGKDHGHARQSTQADRYRYLQGEFSDTIDH